MVKPLYHLPFTAVLAVPADIRARGVKSDVECFYWHGEAVNSRQAGLNAQKDAAEAYGITTDKADTFSILFVFKGLHRDVYYTDQRLRTS
jgi:hypothetical protein